MGSKGRLMRSLVIRSSFQCYTRWSSRYHNSATSSARIPVKQPARLWGILFSDTADRRCEKLWTPDSCQSCKPCRTEASPHLRSWSCPTWKRCCEARLRGSSLLHARNTGKQGDLSVEPKIPALCNEAYKDYKMARQVKKSYLFYL